MECKGSDKMSDKGESELHELRSQRTKTVPGSHRKACLPQTI